MIGVVYKEGWLPKETAVEMMKDVGEDVVYFESFKEIQAFNDKDKIEILINTNLPEMDVIKEMTGLKWIMSYTAGVDAYDLEGLKELGIKLTTTSGLHKTNIAEQVFGAMIMFSRNILKAMYNKRDRKWEAYPLDELIGKNILIIGTGKIGVEIARKAKVFDMKVSGVRASENPALPENFDEINTIGDLHNVLPGKDYVVLVVPSTKDTKKMFGAPEFALMDKKSVFINVGRGDTVDEAALYETLKEKRIRGAYSDVFENEPLPSDSPFWELENLIITPHNAGPTPHYNERAFDIFKNNLKRFRGGEGLLNIIDYNKKY
ncbi:MAG: D-2-hydroxyacid dehydrogenase [Clostridiaceae bacterium]